MNTIPKRKWRRSEILLLVVPFLLLPLAWLWSATRPAPVPPPPFYDVTDLGTLGGVGGAVKGMNDHGDVVGSWGNSVKNARPFILRNGKVQLIGTGKGYSTTASDVNNVGEVAGTLHNSDWESRAFSWRNGKLTFLPSLGGKESYAIAINERGQIVGSAETRFKRPYGEYKQCAVLWEKGQVRNLNVPPERSSSATGINNVGEIVGYKKHGSFLWRKGSVIDVGGVGVSAAAWDINDKGTIIMSTMGLVQLWRDGHGKEIQMPQGTVSSFPSAINNAGQGVGLAQVKRRWIAFLCQNNQLYDLNALVPGSGWILSDADDINERGQIVGMGQFKGQRHGFLLTPITR